MRVFSQVLACDGYAQGSVMLFFDEQRLLFDVPEGTQRYCTEVKLKMMKVKGIFLTRAHPDHMLGLPGLLLTLREQERTKNAEEGQKGIKDAMKAGTLHAQYAAVRDEKDMMAVAGPEGLAGLMGSMRPFLKCPGFYKVHEVGGAQGAAEGGRVVFTSAAKPYFEVRAQESGGAVSYRVDIPEQPGKFLPQKAAELGVKGKKRADLVRGEKVESDTIPGRWVELHEVTAPPTPRLSIFLAAAPLDATLKSFFASGPTAVVKAVYHLAPPKAQTAQYVADYSAFFAPLLAHAPDGAVPGRQWFAPPAGAGRRHTVYHSSALQHDRLSVVSAELFPAERQGWADAADARAPLGAPRHEESIEELRCYNIVGGQNIKEGSISDPRPPLDLAAGRDEWPACFKDECAGEAPAAAPAEASYPRVTMLGTGGMMPSKYRNVTSVYVAPTPGCHILLDAGEGTLGQLRRCVDADAVLAGLNCVWISHIHADHHVGLATLLSRRASLNPALPELLVVGPRSLEDYLKTFGAMVDLRYTFRTCKSGVLNVAPGVVLESVAVHHCSDSYGCVITGDGWKVVNSGDTRPCEALVTAGKDCDVLLHEATFEDDKQEDAVSKNHSTVSEALGVAVRMNAKQTVLTHFSQRYPKLPPPMEMPDGHSVALAFDLMQLTTSSAPALVEMNKRLTKLNAYYDAIEEEKQKVATAITNERRKKEDDAREFRVQRRLEKEAKQKELGALRREAKRRKGNDGKPQPQPDAEGV